MWLVKTEFELNLPAPQGCFQCAQKRKKKLILVPTTPGYFPKQGQSFPLHAEKQTTGNRVDQQQIPLRGGAT